MLKSMAEFGLELNNIMGWPSGHPKGVHNEKIS